MKVGYVRDPRPLEALDEETRAIERAGCERIIVETGQRSGAGGAALQLLMQRLQPGDVLIVWRLDRVAESVPRLIELVLDLRDRGVGLVSLSEAFSTAGAVDAGLIEAFQMLRDFDERLHRHGLGASASGRVGRPRAMSSSDLERARALLYRERRPVNEVASTLGVSRATLYRYLAQR